MTNTKALTCLATLVLLCSLNAHAQSASTPTAAEPPVAWSLFVGHQLSASLQSSVAEIRHRALRQVTHLATYRREVDLSDTIPALLAIYRNDPKERCRLAAVAALYALGDEDALIRLRQGLRRQSSPRVQLATLGTLMAFYGPATFADDPEMARLAEAIREQATTVIDTSVSAPVVARGQ